MFSCGHLIKHLVAKLNPNISTVGGDAPRPFWSPLFRPEPPLHHAAFAPALKPLCPRPSAHANSWPSPLWSPHGAQRNAEPTSPDHLAPLLCLKPLSMHVPSLSLCLRHNSLDAAVLRHDRPDEARGRRPFRLPQTTLCPRLAPTRHPLPYLAHGHHRFAAAAPYLA